MEVVLYYIELKEQKEKAKQATLQPYPKNGTKADKKAHRDKVLAAKAMLKRNLQKECSKKFGWLGRCQVCKWYEAYKNESWQELPEVVRRRGPATTNEWRRKCNLTMKGRPFGGGMPYELQRELDILIGEMTMGTSAVSERREVVTADCIVAWFCFDLTGVPC